MKQLFNSLLFSGLIMVAASMLVGMAYHFGLLVLTITDKLNVTTLYLIGMVLSIIAVGYKLFKESK